MATEQRDHLVSLCGTHQASIHKHTSQLVPNRLMNQDRRHGSCHAARQAANHPATTHLFTNGGA